MAVENDQNRELDLREREVITKEHESLLREREVLATERDSVLREREVLAKEVELKRSWRKNPIAIALIGAMSAIVANLVVTILNNNNQSRLLQSQIEGNITVEAIKAGSDQANCKNLSFFVRLGLIKDERKAIEIVCKDYKEVGPPSLPAAPAHAISAPARYEPSAAAKVIVDMPYRLLELAARVRKREEEVDASNRKQENEMRQSQIDNLIASGKSREEAERGSFLGGSARNALSDMFHDNIMRSSEQYRSEVDDLLKELHASTIGQADPQHLVDSEVFSSCIAHSRGGPYCSVSLERLAKTIEDSRQATATK